MVLETLLQPSSLLYIPILLTIWVLAPWFHRAWIYRNVPGPFALPFIGNVFSIMKYGLHEYLLQCKHKYGKVFKVYIGKNMLLVCCDPEVCRRVNYKMINRNIAGQLRLGDENDNINNQGLVVVRNEQWRTLRLAWQPAFQSGSLEGYADLMDSCAKELAEHVAQLGQGGQEVEMWRELGKMTLAVVGSTAYGVDFHTLHAPSNEAAAEGSALIKACQTVFAASSLSRGGLYAVLNAVLPLPRLVGWFAKHFPDEKLSQLLQARHIIRAVSYKLISEWRSAHPITANGTVPAATAATAAKETPLIETISATVPVAGGSAPHANGHNSDSSNNATGLVAKQDAVSDRDQVQKTISAGADDQGKQAGVWKRAAGVGVAPGSFMGLMLSVKDKITGNALPDTTVVAQANTFTLAGYETTANTLSYCVYNIAAHPQVQERLLKEVDAYGRHRKVEYRDMDQFPYAEAIVRESLRLYPPATFLVREIKEGGFDLMGKVHVPAGHSISTFLYAYQRDPEYWPAALEFRPERWLPEGADLAPTTPDAWTPFGAGPRMCIGWKFALQEAKIALIRLYQNQTYELLPGQMPLALQQNITLSPKHGVRVTVHPRTSAA